MKIMEIVMIINFLFKLYIYIYINIYIYIFIHKFFVLNYNM